MKKKVKRKRRPSVPLAMLVPPPPPTTEDVPNDLEIICPMCLSHFANAVVKFGQAIKAEHFSVRDDLKGSTKFQKSGLPICPMCGYKFTPLAVYGMMVQATARARLERKAWTREGRQNVEPKPESFGMGS